MKTKALFFYSKVLSFFLLLLGFSSCSEDGIGGGDTRLEYGTPSAKFKIKGAVKSLDNQQSIKNIKAVVVETHQGKDHEISAPVSTDSEGRFTIEFSSFPANDPKFELKLEDVDGEANGLFDTKTVTVEFVNPSYVNGSGNWYRGEVEKDIKDVLLTPTKKN